MKNRIRLFLLIVVITVLSCGKDEKKDKKIIRPVKYQEIKLKTSGKSLTFSGTARTDKVINLSFRTSGIVTEHNLKIGQEVKKSDLLAKLDNVQSRLSYERAVSALNSAESQLNTAKLSFNRIRSLYEKGSASLSDFEAAKNSYKTAQESFESSKRGVDIEMEQVRYGYLYAPDNGIISAVYIELDENVSPGQTVAVLNAGTDMEVLLGIPESVINRVKQAMEVSIRLTALQEKEFIGKVSEVSPAVDANSATYPVRVVFTNPSEEVKSGMAASVKFYFNENEESGEKLIVPAHAVGEDSNGRYVFIIKKNNDTTIVKKQKVTIGELTAEGFEIMGGLKPNQKIVTAGLQTLLDGQEVSPIDK